MLDTTVWVLFGCLYIYILELCLLHNPRPICRYSNVIDAVCISNVVCDDTSVNAIAGVVVSSVGPHTQVGVCCYILSIGK